MSGNKILLVLIIGIGALWRLWNFDSRWMLNENNARELVADRYGASNNLLPLTNPINWHRFALGQLVRKDLPVFAPWLLVAMASVATIPTFYLLGRKMVNGRFGIVCAVVVAFASELILQPVQLNMLSIALLIIGVGTWLALKRNLLSMPLIAWGLSFEGTNVRNMGVLLFNNKEVSWAIVAMAIVATVIVIKKNGWEWDKDWLVVPSGIILGLINPICWVVVVVLITAFVGHVLISLVPNKELLLWIGIGVMGFWSLQNWDLVKTKNNYKVFIEAKAFIDKIYPDPAGKIKFFELDNSKASVLPLMYMYSQAGRLSEEGTPVIIFHDPVQIQIYLWRQGIEGYVRSVAALDVFNNKY